MAMRKYVTKKKQFLHGGDYNPDQWLDRPDILAEDLEFMRLSKTTTFSLGIFAWSALEPREGEYDFGWLDDLFEKIHNIGGFEVLQQVWKSGIYLADSIIFLNEDVDGMNEEEIIEMVKQDAVYKPDLGLSFSRGMVFFLS